jgi:hypothetical protein
MGDVMTLAKRSVGLVAVALSLGGCASIVEGVDQKIKIAVSPPEATCTAVRKGETIGQTGNGNDVLDVSKSRFALDLTCASDGYVAKTTTVESEPSAWGIVGAIVIDYGVIDYATGALNKYPDEVQVMLEKESAQK